MDSYDFVDSVKVEKANALARYRRFRNIAKFFQLVEVIVAVALLSWSSTRLPSVFKLSGEYLLAFSSYLLNPHVVFIVGNVLVVACYVLSRHTDAGNESAGSDDYDEKYSSPNPQKTTEHTSNRKFTPNPPAEESPVTKEMTGDGNQNLVVPYENATVKMESEVVAETAIKQAAKQIERFQRTQSTKLKREISTKPRPELRRSVTESRASMVVTSNDGGAKVTSFDTVEKLSNEEFRLAVEAFISKQQSFLKAQSLAENCV